jgi:hypothetical protein
MTQNFSLRIKLPLCLAVAIVSLIVSLGSTAQAQLPYPHIVPFTAKFNDNLGNKDGAVNPGEVIQVYLSVFNTGGTSAKNVQIQVTSTDSSSTPLAPNLVTISSIGAMGGATSAALQIQISNSVVNNQNITIYFNVSSSNAGSFVYPFTINASVKQPYSLTKLNFTPGAFIADHKREAFYMINRDSNYIVAINTPIKGPWGTSGWGKMASSATLNPPYSVAHWHVDTQTGQLAWKNFHYDALQTGQLAVSLDGTILYVCLSSSKQIQKFALPGLAPLGLINCGFTPEAIAVGVNNNLYVSDYNHTGYQQGSVYQLSGSGTILSILNFDIPYGTGASQVNPVIVHSLLKRNNDGTRLYVSCWPSSVYSNPHNEIKEYNISGSTPVLTKTFGAYPSTLTSDGIGDFVVDDTALYFGPLDTSTVGRVRLDTGEQTQLYTGYNDGNCPGIGMSPLASSFPTLFAGTNPNNPDYLNIGTGPILYEQNRASGRRLLKYNFKPSQTIPVSIVPQGVAVTPLRKVMVMERSGFWPDYTNSNNYYVYLIGNSSAINIQGTPVNAAPKVDLGPDKSFSGQKSFNLTASIEDDGFPNPPGILTYKWIQVSGPGIAVFQPSNYVYTQVTVGAPGVYTFRLTVSDGALSTSDTINVSAYF